MKRSKSLSVAVRPSTSSATAKDASAVPVTLSDPTLQRAVQLAERGDCAAALQLLRSHGQDRETLNAIGVCLMRLGQTSEAIKLYRTMVLMPNCTWMRPDLPTHYKTNFATALLLGGHPAGCLEMLDELGSAGGAVAEQLYAAVKRWESTLGLWRWIDWRICRVEPAKVKIELGFTPGEFVAASPARRPDQPQPAPRRAA